MFPYIVLASAFFLATIAAWFSVSGIAHLFVGAGLAAGFMATALEIGKLVGISFLYRYQHTIPRLLRTYMWIGTVVLMFITSIGIYGYLASAYASSASSIQQKENEITLYTAQQSSIDTNIKRLTDRSSQLQNLRLQQENRVDELVRLGRSTTTQQRIIRDQDAEINKIQSEVNKLTTIKDSLLLQKTNVTNSISTTGKIGTFYYVAQTLNVPLDTIVKWFIIILVLVFDPMSVSLFIAYNIIVDKKQKTVQSVFPKITNVESSEVLSEVAHDSDKTSLIKNDGTDDTVELSAIPYYMQPGYDWNTDTRWHDDMNARGFKSNLGY